MPSNDASKPHIILFGWAGVFSNVACFLCCSLLQAAEIDTSASTPHTIRKKGVFLRSTCSIQLHPPFADIQSADSPFPSTKQVLDASETSLTGLLSLQVRGFSSYRQYALKIYEEILQADASRPIVFHLFSMNGVSLVCHLSSCILCQSRNCSLQRFGIC